MDFFEFVDGHTGVDLSGFQRLMTQHLLDVSYRCAVSEHVGGAGMTQGMGGYILLNTGLVLVLFDLEPYAVPLHLMSPSV